MRFVLIAILALCEFTHAIAADPEPLYADRWIYLRHNLLVDKNVDVVIGLLERAGKSGYNGAVIADYKLNILERMPKRYFDNVEKVKAAAAKAHIELIPALFPIGYSDGLLVHDPNLAEGIPVKDAPFQVKDGIAQPQVDATVFKNGDLEKTKGDRFVGFSFQDEPGKITFADPKLAHGGKISCRMQATDANARIVQSVKLRPWACYRFSCWMKTEDAGGEARLLALGKDSHQLTFHEFHLKPTQDWTLVDVVFNTLDETEINLYAGVWGGLKGKLWLDDFQLEELSLVNVLRRAGCPLTIRSADGKTTYEEGKDFLAIRDEQLFRDPHEGSCQFRHKGPTVRLTPQSRIKDGDHLKISWYHPIHTHESQVMCCLTDPKVIILLRDQAKRVHDLFHAKTVFMSHDEIRVAGWCRSCSSSGKTPGELLAINVKDCVGILKALDKNVRIVVWSDMFDPYHNAVDKYYLVNGSLKGSWNGLDKDVVLANWNSGKSASSLRWFADRGHSQIIAGYYDSDINNFKKWREAAQGIPRVTGFMYTTWEDKFDQLEDFGKAMLGK